MISRIEFLSPGFLLTGAVLLGIVAILGDIAGRFHAKRLEAEGAPPADARTSFLALISFGFAMVTAITVFGAGFLVWLGDNHDLVELSLRDRQPIYLAARIVSICTLAPAIAAIGFWLASRAVITDSEGRLRGRSLYKTAVFVTAVALICAFAGESSVSGTAKSRLDEIRNSSLETEDSAVEVPEPDEKVAECNQLLVSLKEKILRYEKANGTFPEPGGENLLQLEPPEKYRGKNRVLDPWNRRIEWVRQDDKTWQLYSAGPNGVDDGGFNDDIILTLQKGE